MSDRRDQQSLDPSRVGLSVNLARLSTLVGGAMEWTKLQLGRYRQRRDERWAAKIRDEATRRINNRKDLR